MKVLFVDDEQFILNALNRALFTTGWQIKYATSGEQALDILKNFAADFIVSDMRMPGMNGVDLLEKVSQLYPSTVRIILSGHADLDLSVRASYVAHQWFNKPCDLLVLKTEIERINNIRCDIAYEEVRQIVGAVNTLPSVPKTFINIKIMLRTKSVTMKDISSLIAEDPSLCAKVLQVVNSSFIISSNNVTKIEDAVIRLGVEAVSNIVAVAEIYSSIVAVPSVFLQETLQKGLQIAKLASKIAEKSDRDITMLAGILHNIGELILWQLNPEGINVYLENRKRGQDNTELEQQIFNVDNIQIASYLLHLWHFPYSIIECITLQNKIDKLINYEFGGAVAIYIAKSIINGQEVDEEIISHFGISEQLDQWRKIEG
ncbi:MAG: HD-like signal output (HDOD) protein [Paraglaciecola sp.]|jgi:HD-like signal output (HDOD) protein